jgi:hypothetical protein
MSTFISYNTSNSDSLPIDSVLYTENNDMEDICSVLTELKLGSHILNGKLVAFKATAAPNEKNIVIKVESDCNAVEYIDNRDKLVAQDDLPRHSSYLRCGKLNKAVDLTMHSNFISSMDGTNSSNFHRRRSTSLGSSANTKCSSISPSPRYIRQLTFPPSSNINKKSSSRINRTRSASLNVVDKSVKKPSRTTFWHHQHLRRLATSALSECFPDRCFDPPLQQFTFTTAAAVMTQVSYSIHHPLEFNRITIFIHFRLTTILQN